MSTAPKFDPDYTQEDYGCLLCPRCGGPWLHQFSVDVYERREDAEVGTHTHARGSRTVVDGDMSGNPSSRRDGTVIKFFCEWCPRLVALHVVQHKGITMVSTEILDELAPGWVEGPNGPVAARRPPLTGA